MSITNNATGFTKAVLRTECYAQLFATKAHHDFRISLTADSDDGWLFDRDGCIEAAQFFTMLAEELKREK